MMQRTRAAMNIGAPVLSAVPAVAAKAGVIPQPAKVESGSGSFTLSSATVIQASSGSAAELQGARYLSALWKRSNHLTLAVRSTQAVRAGAAPIIFQTAPGFAAEGYRLEVSPHRITVSATTAA